MDQGPVPFPAMILVNLFVLLVSAMTTSATSMISVNDWLVAHDGGFANDLTANWVAPRPPRFRTSTNSP